MSCSCHGNLQLSCLGVVNPYGQALGNQIFFYCFLGPPKVASFFLRKLSILIGSQGFVFVFQLLSVYK